MDIKMNELHPAMIGEVQPNYELLADAIYKQEGGDKTKWPYGIKSVRVKDASEARQVAINTMRNNYKRWLDSDKMWEGKQVPYVVFTANRFVPPTADPKGNKDWIENVPKIYAALDPNHEEFPVLPLNYKPVIPNYGVE